MRWLVVIGVTIAAQAAGAATPSFDCARATTWSEKSICTDEGLAMLDREMATAFSARQETAGDIGREQLRVDQRAWLETREQCRSEADPIGCLTSRYRSRIRQLTGKGPARGGDYEEARGALGECRRESRDAEGIGLCLDRKLAAATAAFGDAEAAMLDRLASREDAAAAFRESQDAFIRFRDGTCRWRSALDPSASPDVRQACLVDFTRARTAEIEGLLR